MNINYNPHFRTRTGNVRGFLKEVKYKLDFYQREYVWGKDCVLQFLNDLTDCFLSNYQPEHDRKMVANYSHYYLGNITTSKHGAYVYIIDGQQRLTTLTLLLVLLRNLQKERDIEFAVDLDKLIFSSTYGQKSFNLNIDERIPFLEALFHGKEREFDVSAQSKSVKNMFERFGDLRDNLHPTLSKEALPYFADWLLHRVNMVEISVYPPEITHSIFENLNDRGQPLIPVELLKGYLLANIDIEKRSDAEELWNNQITAINEAVLGKESDCIKNWFWSQYAQNISLSSDSTELQDFERIDNEFHRWLADMGICRNIGLNSSEDYFDFIKCEFNFYSEQYIKISNASVNRIPGLESVQNIAQLGADYRFIVLLSPLKPSDSDELTSMKIQLTAYFIEILLLRKIWNDESIRHSVMIHPMFKIMKNIRELDFQGLKKYFTLNLENEVYKFEHNSAFGLNKRNGKYIHWILSRITDYIEVESGLRSRFDQYMSQGSDGYELDHILQDYSFKKNRVRDETDIAYALDRVVYDLKRNSIGGLVLLPNSVISKLGSRPTVEEKLNQYKSENVLARSLHPDFYRENSEFSQFIKRSNLSFKPFSTSESEIWVLERSLLYSKVANQIWAPENFDKCVKNLHTD